MKRIISIILLLILIIIPFKRVVATTYEYINVNDYGIYGNDSIDDTTNIQNLLNNYQNQNIGLYFPTGKYIISNNILLRSGVSLKGDENNGTIFYGDNESHAVILRDSFNVDLSNISITNFIFDNIVFLSNSDNHDNWLIANNIFINGKRADLDLMTGLKPDVNNKNGGELTAYYILRNNQKITIENNIFLRDENSKGRGIGLWKNDNSIIRNNYFGMLEKYDANNILLTNELKKLFLRLDHYQTSKEVIVNSNQGYFMTTINVLNDDNNIRIHDNIFNLNTDIEEINYNDGSGLTFGYNRDHIIYAKGFDELYIYNNYFHGQPNNADGGVKLRNGKNLVVSNNYFNDVALLLYIQDDHPTLDLENVYVNNNIFKGMTNNGKWGSGISMLIYNYNNLRNITFENNHFLSNELKEDFIHINLRNLVSGIENLHVENNYYHDNIELVMFEYTQRKDLPNITNNENYLSTNPYRVLEFELLDKLSNYEIYEVDYEIIDNKIVSSGKIFVNNKLYQNEELKGSDYIYIVSETEIMQIVEGIQTFIYANLITSFTYQENPEPPLEEFIVTFNSNGGSLVLQQLVEKGSKAIKPTDPIKDGYIFLGWFNGETEFNFDTLINSEITLTANWVAIKLEFDVSIDMLFDNNNYISSKIINMKRDSRISVGIEDFLNENNNYRLVGKFINYQYTDNNLEFNLIINNDYKIDIIFSNKDKLAAIFIDEAEGLIITKYISIGETPSLPSEFVNKSLDSELKPQNDDLIYRVINNNYEG